MGSGQEYAMMQAELERMRGEIEEATMTTLREMEGRWDERFEALDAEGGGHSGDGPPKPEPRVRLSVPASSQFNPPPAVSGGTEPLPLEEWALLDALKAYNTALVNEASGSDAENLAHLLDLAMELGRRTGAEVPAAAPPAMVSQAQHDAVVELKNDYREKAVAMEDSRDRVLHRLEAVKAERDEALVRALGGGQNDTARACKREALLDRIFNVLGGPYPGSYDEAGVQALETLDALNEQAPVTQRLTDENHGVWACLLDIQAKVGARFTLAAENTGLENAIALKDLIIAHLDMLPEQGDVSRADVQELYRYIAQLAVLRGLPVTLGARETLGRLIGMATPAPGSGR